MRGQWIFVLVFMSFVGELVLGSLFPTTQNGPPPTPVATQQEVEWPLENIDTRAEVIVPAEAEIYSHGLQVEQTKDGDSESGRLTSEIMPKIIIINQDPDVQIVTRDNAELDTNNSTIN